MGANKRKKAVEEHCAWSSEHGSAASMLCGLEEVTGSLWSTSVAWEENERVSLTPVADSTHMALLLVADVFALTAGLNMRLNPNTDGWVGSL